MPANNYERITLLLVDEGFCKKEPTTPKAVFMLNWDDNTVPMVVSFNGIDFDIVLIELFFLKVIMTMISILFVMKKF